MRTRLYTGGTFDLFHAGHAEFLRRCNRYADYVVVSVNTDDFIESYKGRPPVCSLEERIAVLRACRYVTDVTVNEGGKDSRPAVERVQPQVVAIGSDWATKDYHAQMGFSQGWLDERGIDLLFVPYTAGVSTTILRGRMGC